MRRNLRLTASLLLVLTLLSAVALVASDKKKKHSKNQANNAAMQLDEQKRAIHVLNRFTFGPRPGDVQKVEAMGVDKWFEQQLHPDKIDDGALAARLSPFRTLNMSTTELVKDFPPPQLIKMVENGRASIPRDPQEKAIYQAALDRERQKQAVKQEAADNQAISQNDTTSDGKPRRSARQAEDRMYASLNADGLMNEPPDQRFRDLMKMSPDDMRATAQSLNQQEREQLVDGFTPQQKETLLALVNPQLVVQGELMQAKLLRSIYSERQLEEVMTDFWMNHFNVFINKGQPEHYFLTSYERDVIRPRALGKFKDLLVATAKSPAMLFYLDNWQSIGPNSDVAKNGGRPQRPGRFRRGPFGTIVYEPPRQPAQQNPQQKAKRPSGLNENYAREVMELHTLGVGNYTQKDVTELAKVLTGWSIDRPQQGGEFRFNERAHEPGKKHVLGKDFKEDGESEGMKALDMLAHNPATAQFISRKLAVRFVSDNPPESLVQSMAKTFQDSDGDISEVLRTMFHSPEFWAPDTYRAKVKTPFDFVVSAIRASGADVERAQPLIQQLQKLGMPLYGMQTPNGYSMKSDAWVNSAALLNRMNFGLALASGKLPGIQWDPSTIVASSETPADATGALANFESVLLDGDVSRQTHNTILAQLNDPQAATRNNVPAASGTNLRLIAGLLLGSPDFQRR
ncbi:MAG: DUF1800 domain-containing protein [Acidobacteria bacterium]|nr:DUF1800 domain-containing protein [Acidobacteriota bacterium]